MMRTAEVICEKGNASPRLPPKISFEDNWMKELGPTNPTKDNPIVSTERSNNPVRVFRKSKTCLA